VQQDQRPRAIVTSASSGVGIYATKALVDRGWHVVMACRDLAKAKAAAVTLNIRPDSVSSEWIDVGSQASVREFAARFKAGGLPLYALVCNVAVYLPLLKQPVRSPEGYEISVATNHFGHSLIRHLALPKRRCSATPQNCSSRCFRGSRRTSPRDMCRSLWRASEWPKSWPIRT
jgi:protochlorophyllide reductase